MVTMPAEYHNILVRGVNRIGDTIFSLPSIKALKQGFPGSRITILTKPAPAGLFENNPSIDDVLLFDSMGRHKGVLGRIRLIRELRKRSFDLAVLFHNCFDAALIPFLAGISERIGYIREARGLLLTKKLPFPKTPIHQIDHYLKLVSLMGISTEEKTPELFITPEEKNRAGDLFDRNHVRRPLVGFIPGSIALTRRWYPERFAELGDRLVETTGGSILILGGPADRDISETIINHTKVTPLDMTGRIDLRQLMALLSHCDLVVSNDTGPMHIAWSLGKHVITFLGAADIREIKPHSSRVTIIRKDLDCSPCIKEVCPNGTIRCLDLISVEEVFNKSMEILAHETKEHPDN